MNRTVFVPIGEQRGHNLKVNYCNTMTSKNKRTVKDKKTKVAKASNNEQAPESSMEEPKLKSTFTKAQLAGLVFLSLGASKIIEFSIALKEGPEDPKTCMSYLDHEETCAHPSFSSMILVKYYSALSLTALVVSMMLLVWKSETVFLKFLTCLCISPLSTTVLAASFTYSQGYVQRGRAWHLIIMCFVLFAICAPTSVKQLAFLPDRPWTTRSLQSICLITLAMASLCDIWRVVNAETNWENSLLTTSTPLPEPARALIHYWIVDKVSMALLFAFAVVHFPEHTQRVSIH
jgi:hypothetical protein